MNQKKIDRINQLARKSRVEKLTVEELKEQKNLRQEYIDAFKRNMRHELDRIKFVD